MFRYITFIIFALIISTTLNAQQGLYISDASLYSENNSLLHVEGDINISNAGTIENNGDIELTENWINNAGNTGLVNNRPGNVSLIGGNQIIGGSSVTEFFNLNLLGGYSLKECLQDVLIRHTLDINNAELQVHQNNFHILNPDPLSVYWNNGFVSGDSIGGYFSRSTNQVADYRFPVGNATLFTSVYRAIDVTPVNADSNVYGVRLAAVDPTYDNTGTSFSGATGPYARSLKNPAIVEINPTFYHHINRQFGVTAADIKMYYFESDHLSQDRKLEGVAQWNSATPRWDFIDAKRTANILGPTDIGSPENYMSWTGRTFDDDVFALDVLEGMLAFVPQIFSPNGDGANDVLYVRGRKIEKLNFIIYNRWGEKVFETTDKNIGWDGKFRGVNAQSSVYVYYLEAEVEDYGKLEQKGNITLVR